MKPWTFLYNKVQDVVLTSEEQEEIVGIGEHLFVTAAINAEVDLYNWYLTTDRREVWLIWRVQIKEWMRAESVPEIVKLTRMLLG